MPRRYKPRQSDLGACPDRDLSQLESAAALLGETAVLGCELSFELQSLAVNPTHPSRDDGDAWMRRAFVLLQGMLVAERWLIEFLTGPAAPIDPNTNQRRKRDTDICVDCFILNWRLPAGSLADELVNRLSPINELAAHPTWSQVIASPRQWTLTRVSRCVDGLTIFADALRDGLPTVATIIDRRTDEARHALEGGRSDGVRWFELVRER